MQKKKERAKENPPLPHKGHIHSPMPCHKTGTQKLLAERITTTGDTHRQREETERGKEEGKEGETETEGWRQRDSIESPMNNFSYCPLRSIHLALLEQMLPLVCNSARSLGFLARDPKGSVISTSQTLRLATYSGFCFHVGPGDQMQIFMLA